MQPPSQRRPHATTAAAARGGRGALSTQVEPTDSEFGKIQKSVAFEIADGGVDEHPQSAECSASLASLDSCASPSAASRVRRPVRDAATSDKRRLIVLDLDYTVWRFYAEEARESGPPFLPCVSFPQSFRSVWNASIGIWLLP